MPEGKNPRFQPHVLIVSRPDHADPSYVEWEVEHHEECPRSCFWWPEAAAYYKPPAAPLVASVAGAFDLPVEIIGVGKRCEWQYDCYVQHELDNNGLDSLTDQEDRDWMTHSWIDGHRGLTRRFRQAATCSRAGTRKAKAGPAQVPMSQMVA